MTSLLSTIVVAIILALTVWLQFSRWKKRTVAKLCEDSTVIKTARGEVEYQIVGDEGEPVLFLHGSPGGYDQYAIHQSPSFSRFCVISISRFGYLRTPLKGAITLSQQADALSAFLDALSIDQIIVSAASGGGPLALAFAARYPERVRCMTLYAAVSQSMGKEYERPGIQVLKAITRSDFLSWLLLRPLIKKPEKMVRMLVKNEENAEAIIRNGDAAVFAGGLQVALPPSLRNPGIDLDEALREKLCIATENITAPVLLVHGDQDLHVPYAHSQQLVEQLPNATLVVVAGGDHFLGYTHGDIVEPEYQEFFARTIKG